MGEDRDTTGEEMSLSFEAIAEAFVEALRSGDRRSIDAWVELHPQHEREIRDVFPALLAMEDMRSLAGGATSTPLRPAIPLVRLGEYKILREIGRGGMGVVYEAEQESLGRRVALKVLNRALVSDETQLERFRLEARAAARLHHTNIVPVFGVGEENGIHFYAMQFIRGHTIADVVKEVRRLVRAAEEEEEDGAGHPAPSRAASFRGRWRATRAASDMSANAGALRLLGDDTASPGEREPRLLYCRNVAKIGLQIAEALACAHAEGIVHRDIKPSNLLLDARGTVWVTDFGLAKAADSSDLTASGSLLGTLRYMAPERFSGRADAQSDIYGLGVTLYELLTLAEPFSGTDRAQIMRDIAQREPPRPRRIDPRIPRDLETIVLGAMAKDPSARYRNAREVADDLRRFLAYEPIAARRHSSWTRFRRWCQRNPAVATLSATVFALVLAIAIGATVGSFRLRREREVAFDRLAQAKLEEARAWRRTTEAGRRERILAALEELEGRVPAVDARSEAISAFAMIDLEETTSWETDGLRSTLGEIAAVLDREGGIELYPTDSRERPLRRLVHGERRSRLPLRLSRNARWLAAGHDGRANAVAVWDVESGEAPVAELVVPASAHGEPFDFWPDEKRIVAVQPDGTVKVFSLPSGRIERSSRSIVDPKAPTFYVACDPRGERLAVAEMSSRALTVSILDSWSLEVVARLYQGSTIRSLDFHPGGDLLAVGCEDSNVYLWSTKAGRLERVLRGHSAEVVRVSFDDEGTLLASSAWDTRTRLWDIDTGETIVTAFGTIFEFSRDRARLPFSRSFQHEGIWTITGGEVYRAISAPVGHSRRGPYALAFSPDGRWIAAACGDSGARIWSTDAPSVEATVMIGPVRSVGFHPETGALYTLGDSGLLEWPIATRAETETNVTEVATTPAGERFVLGPPRARGIQGRQASFSPRGERIVVTSDRRFATIHELSEPPREVFRLEHLGVSGVDVSASGRWAVSYAWQGAQTKIWDLHEKRLVRELDTRTAWARFSPDESWLVVSQGAIYDVYRSGEWTKMYSIERNYTSDVPGSIAFSPDSRYLLLVVTPPVPSLHDVSTGKLIARFEPPGELDLPSDAVVFSSDGSRFALGTLNGRIHLWDLDRARERLASLGLDWESPGRVPERAVDAARPRELSIDYGKNHVFRGELQLPGSLRSARLLDLLTRIIDVSPSVEALRARADLLERSGRFDDALDDLDRAILRSPEDDALFERRAALLERLGRTSEALADRRRAVELRGGKSNDG